MKSNLTSTEQFWEKLIAHWEDCDEILVVANANTLMAEKKLEIKFDMTSTE